MSDSEAPLSVAFDIRYAIYTRQSVERPADFSSCEAQFTKCQALADRGGNENVVWVGQRFDDEGESGGTLNRPALTRLRALVQSRGVERVYVTALDRLARRVYDLIALLEEFERAGVKVQLAQEFNPPDGAQAKLIRHLLGVFAEFECDMIATRIAETRAYLRSHGRRIAGPVPLGYTADAKTRQLVIVPKEARRVRLIFDRAARGQTPAQIAARINHLKWRTKAWVAHRSGKMRGGGKWTARQVLYLLRNPVYTGRHREAHGARPGSHPPIVDQEQFERVQTVLANRRTITNTTRRPLDFPLRGKIVCPKCRRRLSSQISSRSLGLSRVQRRFYCCRSSAGGRPPCRGVRYPAYELERFVCQRLEEQSVWRDLLSPEQTAQATQYAAVWSGLGDGLQGDLIGQMVERVTFARKNTEMRITFTASCHEVIPARIQQN
jgi:site-specific DNA recombinase